MLTNSVIMMYRDYGECYHITNMNAMGCFAGTFQVRADHQYGRESSSRGDDFDNSSI